MTSTRCGCWTSRTSAACATAPASPSTRRAATCNYLRLAYGWASHEDIEKGIPLLAQCVAEARALTVEAR